MFEPLEDGGELRTSPCTMDILTSGSDIGLMDTILMGSSPRLGSVTRMED